MGFFGSLALPRAKALSFMPHPYALYVKKPNADGLYPSNNLGYAGKRALTTHRKRNSVRIYCVGGSTVEDHDPDQGPDSSWPGKLEDILASRFPNTTIECVNAGVAGYTSAESLAEFLFRGIDLKPDILLVYHNVNDAWTCQIIEGFKSDYSHARRHKTWRLPWVNRLPQIRYLASYEMVRYRLATKYGKANALLFWVADPPWQACAEVNADAIAAFRRNIASLVTVAEAWSCIPVVIKWECNWAAEHQGYAPPYVLDTGTRVSSLFYEALHANNRALASIARDQSTCQYLEVGPFEPDHFKDATGHFSARGLDEMARRVADGIESVVRSVVAKSSDTDQS